VELLGCLDYRKFVSEIVLSKRANKASVPWLNYLGFVLAVASSGIYVLVKSEGTPKKNLEEDPEYKGLINVEADVVGTSWVDKLGEKQKRIVGVVLALISGVFYGVNFDPPTCIFVHITLIVF
jgi:hypothetical protein